jgi:hypothetical protein
MPRSSSSHSILALVAEFTAEYPTTIFPLAIPSVPSILEEPSLDFSRIRLIQHSSLHHLRKLRNLFLPRIPSPFPFPLQLGREYQISQNGLVTSGCELQSCLSMVSLHFLHQ